jgi:acyl transferase domain-containing protein/NADPH:quinone reductase-like Zn-dependent oxidoreductase/acyl carrier protein
VLWAILVRTRPNFGGIFVSDVAIIGIGCRYAGGIDSPDSFWDFVVGKQDGVVEIPADRWDYRRFYDRDKRAPGRMHTKRAAFMTIDPWEFDRGFFGISAREATSMDPQQRLILEVAWEALDDAGMAAAAAGAAVGVYVGAFAMDRLIVGVAGPALAHVDMHTASGVSSAMLSNRIAHALNLTGPALTVDTACSSSLVAFHLACRALHDGDCVMALAGGVNVMLQPEVFVELCKAGYLAADGRSKSFDAAGDGCGRGEGAGMVVLKLLDDAVRDGDRVYAVVKATGANQDGRTTAIAVPNAEAQETLVRKVCQRSGVAPHEISYVEAHGAGTPVGDPVELRAIGRVYGAVPGRVAPLGVGSLKATLGHTEAAAGVAGIIKSALSIHRRTLAPQGWLDTPNPDIPFAALGLTLQLDAQPVGSEIERMSVAINGFGYGGTNAHVILQEHDADDCREIRPPGEDGGLRLRGVLPVSARSEQAARAMADGFGRLLAEGADTEAMVAAAWTRLFHHPFRVGIPFGGRAELIGSLAQLAAGGGRAPARVIVQRVAEPVFVFSGMGPQWWAMGRELLWAGGAFAAEAAKVDAAFQEIAGWSVLEELLRAEDQSRVTSTAVAEPATFLIQAALVAELAEHGIRPAAIVGHGVGEVAAAYAGGMLSLPEAASVVYHRARLAAGMAGCGGMLAVGLTPPEAAELVAAEPAVDLAAVNSRTSVTLSGDADRLAEIAAELAGRGIFARRLRVQLPYHSHLMDPILGELRTALADLTPRPATVPMYSTVTGALAGGAGCNAQYWCENLRRPVRFADAVDCVIGAGSRIFVEVGPHPVLAAHIGELLRAADETGGCVPTLSRTRTDSASLRETLAGLYEAGALDVEAAAASPSRHARLPRYPWQRARLHKELTELAQQRFGGGRDTYAMLGDADLDRPGTWRLRVGTELLPWIDDHVVDGVRIMPGAAYLDAALSAAAVRRPTGPVALEQIRFVAPLVMAGGDLPILECVVEESSERFLIRSRSARGAVWTINACGRVVAGAFEPGKVAVPDPGELLTVEPETLYRALADRGLSYGPAFRRATSLWTAPDLVVATLDAAIARDSGHLAHPAVVEAALQVVALLWPGTGDPAAGAIVPIGVREVRLFGAFPDQVTVVARRVPDARMQADIDLVDAEQHVCLRIRGARFGSPSPGGGALARLGEIFYEEQWQPREPVDRGVLPPAGRTATVVVSLDGGQTPRAARVAAGAAHAYPIATGRAGVELESALAERLRAAVSNPAADRLHVCVVAGAMADDVADLWTLKRIALAVESFLDTELVERMVCLGGDSVYLTLVTERAFVHQGDTVGPNPRHAALAGARRVLLNEQSRLRWRLVDIEPDTTDEDLAADLAVPGAYCLDNSDEIYLRGGRRWAPVVGKTLAGRLELADRAEPITDPEANFRLELPPSRALSDLAWRRCGRRAPGPGEVELRMQVVGLNHKDPLKIIGLLGEQELAGTYFGDMPGMEGTGTVVRAGPDVTAPRVGEVVAVASRGMLSRYHTTSADAVTAGMADLDPGWCTSATVFGVAEYALLHVARLQPGETVLVHGAAGGVGSAAIQVALVRGARVIGTARTDERRAQVLAAGAQHALHSRTLNFVDDVLRITNGRGADVVISTAPGEILRQNFTAVAEFGRIVEVGKADICNKGLLELANFDRNLSYHSVDLDRMYALRRPELRALIGEVYAKIRAGTYRALRYELYPAEQVAAAFDQVIRSSRTARVAVSLDDPPPVRPQLSEVVIDPAARYLITGGFGVFGLATGRWLVGKGARRLVLLDREGARTGSARTQLDAWRMAGVEVREERVDVTDPAAVAAAVAGAHGPDHPLRGIFHAAGEVDDNRIAAMDFDSIARVYRPKAHGARALRDAVLAAGIELDQFVFYSSAGSMFGIAGQYNYTAANLAVQAYAEAITRSGGVALSVGWGHLAGGGGMAGSDAVAKYLEMAGFDSIPVDEATVYLEQALRLGVTQAAVLPVDWVKLAAAMPRLGRTGRVAGRVAAAAEDNSAAARLRAELAALDDVKQGEVVAQMLAEQLAAVLGVSPESIEMSVPTSELGWDSLMAVEFAARVNKSLGVEFASMQLGRSFTLRQAGIAVAELIVGARADATEGVL